MSSITPPSQSARTEKPPCVHGQVCKAYMKKFEEITTGLFDRTMCILSEDCPDCPYYMPISFPTQKRVKAVYL